MRLTKVAKKVDIRPELHCTLASQSQELMFVFQRVPG